MSRLQKWERLALSGNFSAMPKPFRWEESGRFAHFLNIALVPGGFDRLSNLALQISGEARETGKWQGGAFDLWQCLFFQHRLHRHIAMHDGYDPALNDLCEALRVALNQISRGAAKDIASMLAPSPEGCQI